MLCIGDRRCSGHSVTRAVGLSQLCPPGPSPRRLQAQHRREEEERVEVEDSDKSHRVQMRSVIYSRLCDSVPDAAASMTQTQRRCSRKLACPPGCHVYITAGH